MLEKDRSFFIRRFTSSLRVSRVCSTHLPLLMKTLKSSSRSTLGSLEFLLLPPPPPPAPPPPGFSACRCGSAGRSSWPVATARATVGVASLSGQATHRRTSFDRRKEETLLDVAHQDFVRRAVAGGSFVIQQDRRNHNRSGSLVMVVAVLGRPLRLRVMQRGRAVRPKAGSHGCQRSRRRWWMVSDDGRGFDALPFQPLEHDPPEIFGCEGFQLLESSHFLLDGGRTGAQQFQVLNDSRLLAYLFLDETGSMPTAAGHRRYRFADGDGPFRSASTATQLDGFIQRLYGTIFFFVRTGAEHRSFPRFVARAASLRRSSVFSTSL